MALPARKQSYTFADALEWGEDERVEIINGEVFMMAPPLRIHQEIIGELFRQISNFLYGKQCKAYVAPFGVRPFEEEGDRPEDIDTMVEPDITVVCDPEKLDKYGCKGAPDFIIEILSPSTRRMDLAVKYHLYQRSGVREYWIVDPDGKTVQAFRLDSGRYNAPDVYTAGAVIPSGIWEDFSIDLTTIFTE